MQGIAAIVKAVRRNHALEHATLHMLDHTPNRGALVGQSDWAGFSIYGRVATLALAHAAQRSLRRLQSGDAELAVHSRCGTHLAVAGILGVSGLWLAYTNRKRSVLLSILSASAGIFGGLALAQPLSLALQRSLLTDPQVDNLSIIEVRRLPIEGTTVHRVTTASRNRE